MTRRSPEGQPSFDFPPDEIEKIPPPADVPVVKEEAPRERHIYNFSPETECSDCGRLFTDEGWCTTCRNRKTPRARKFN